MRPVIAPRLHGVLVIASKGEGPQNGRLAGFLDRQCGYGGCGWVSTGLEQQPRILGKRRAFSIAAFMPSAICAATSRPLY
jgi:hypothetical protein